VDPQDTAASTDQLSFSMETPMQTHNDLGHHAYAERGNLGLVLEKMAQRTVELFSLAEGVTLADITKVIRGGLLLDIFLRSNDRSCLISFVQAADAKAFFDHVRRHDLYIKNKKVCCVPHPHIKTCLD
jgi:hypothetical protein